MTRSVFRDDHRMLITGRALAYEMVPGNALRHSVPNFDVVGDGGLYSTAEDLIRWAGNAYTPRAGDAADWRALTQRGVLTTGDTIPYALGVRHDVHGARAVIAHGGAFGGYRAELLRVPEAQLDVAVLCNYAGADPTSLAQRVANVFVRPMSDRSSANLVRRRLAAEDSIPYGAWISRWTGRWFRIAREGDSLVASGAFARTAVNLLPTGIAIPAQRIVVRRSRAPGWEMSLGETGWESLVAVDTTTPRQGAIAATMGDWVAPESDGRLTLIVESGQLTLRRVGAPPSRLAPFGPGRFVAGPVVVTMLGALPYDSLRLTTPRASGVLYVRAQR
jgi:Beta-lactamase